MLLATCRAGIAATPNIRVVAEDNAREPARAPSGQFTPAQDGTFKVYREGDLSGQVTIPYNLVPPVGGNNYATASGNDPSCVPVGDFFGSSSGTLVFAAQETEKTVIIQPRQDFACEGNELIRLTLQAGSGYSLVSPGYAEIPLIDGASAIAFPVDLPSSAAEGTTFTIRLERPQNACGYLGTPLNTFVYLLGDATYGVDYVIQNLPAGASVQPASSGGVVVRDIVIPALDPHIDLIVQVSLDAVAESESVHVNLYDCFTGAWEIDFLDAGGPQPPAPVVYFPTVGDDVVMLRWNPVPSATQYIIQRARDFGQYAGIFYTLGKTAATTFFDEYPSLGAGETLYGPANDEQYTYRVAGINSSGQGPWATQSATPQLANGSITFIVASDKNADENGNTGTFQVVRKGGRHYGAALYGTSLSGTATQNTDYQILNLVVTPVADALVEGSETVIATLQAGQAPYPSTVGYPASATVTIADRPPTVSISAPDNSANETGDGGNFMVTRTGPTTGNLNVRYTVSGSAIPGSDYSALSGTVTIYAPNASAQILVTPAPDLLVEGDEVVRVTVVNDSTYVTGSGSTAEVVIHDVVPVVSISSAIEGGGDPAAGESPADNGKFKISHDGPTGQPLNVNYSIASGAGRALNGTDYQLIPSAGVTIPQGQGHVIVDIVPILDGFLEGEESVQVTLSSGNYSIGTASATVAIADSPLVLGNRSVIPGGYTTFTAPFVSGLSYQWKLNGQDIPGAVLSSYKVRGSAATAGNYSVLVQNGGGGTLQSQPGKVTVPAGMAAWWPGDNTSADILRGNNAAFGGTFGVGKYGQAFTISQSQHAVAPASGGLDVGIGPGMTMEAWIKPSSVSRMDQPLFEWNRPSPAAIGTLFHLSVSSANPAHGGAGSIGANFVDTTGVSHHAFSGPNVVSAGVWTHVAATYNRSSGVAALYADGVMLLQTNLGSFVPQTSYGLYLGHRPAWGLYFAGEMDDVAVYDRALSAEEVGSIATGLKAPLVQWPFNFETDQLIGFWAAVATHDQQGQPYMNPLQDWLGLNDLDPVGSASTGPGLVGDAITLASPLTQVGYVRSSDFRDGALDGTLGSFTYEAWVKPENLNQLEQPLIEWNTGNNEDPVHGIGVHLFMSTTPINSQYGGYGSLYANLIDASFNSHQVITAPNLVKLRTFNHVALTWDNAIGTAAIYLNGEKVAENTTFGSLTLRNDSAFYLGYRPNLFWANAVSWGYGFHGTFDEVTLWGRALNASEIQSIYAAGSLGKLPD